MRTPALLLILALPACSLYFGDGSPPDESGSGSGATSSDAGSGSGSSSTTPPTGDLHTYARCEDGMIRTLTVPLPFYDMPGHGEGTLVGYCEGACRSAIAECPSGDCTQAFITVCAAPAATAPAPTLQGTSCTGSTSQSYTVSTSCAQVLPGGTCTCSGGQYACAPSTDVAGVHASLVGKWRGMVYPPSFTMPYPVSIWIYPDGTYWAQCETDAYCNAFYYGGDGPHPWRRIQVLSAPTDTGATADIGIFFSFNLGKLTALHVTDTTLEFTYYAAWFGCTQPFSFELTRE